MLTQPLCQLERPVYAVPNDNGTFDNGFYGREMEGKSFARQAEKHGWSKGLLEQI